MHVLTEDDFCGYCMDELRRGVPDNGVCEHKLTERESNMEWQPIATAPKDGTEVLLYYPHVDTVIRGAYVPQNEGDWESGIQDWDDWASDNDFQRRHTIRKRKNCQGNLYG